jgi:DNA polymerase-1
MLLFDVESDGFLNVLTKLHCICTYDYSLNKYFRYRDVIPLAPVAHAGTIKEGLKALEEADAIVAHNGIGFDYPAIWKLYPDWNPKGKLLDSMLISRLIYTGLKDTDFDAQRRGFWNSVNGAVQFPEKFGGMYGAHKLEAWGYRLGVFKGEFGKTADWSTWTIEMEDYCVTDVEVTKSLMDILIAKEYSEKAIQLEHDFAWIITRQMHLGVLFDEKAATHLHGILLTRKAELDTELMAIFKPWEVHTWFTPKVNNKTLGYIKDQPIKKTKTVVFNPASTDHVAARLTALFGWVPKDFTPKGKPTIDEAVLGRLDYPPIAALMESMTLAKRLGQVAEGKGAWLKKVENGRIHGYVNTNGAVTGRCTHNSPNLAQVPASGASYGGECRALYIAPKGYKMVGCDADGLELRCLSHYMAVFDKGAYIELVLDGDAHWKNLIAIGVAKGLRDKGNKAHTAGRDAGKTWIYSYLYGCGVPSSGEAFITAYKAYHGTTPKGTVSQLGKYSRDSIKKGLPALAALEAAVHKAIKKGYLVGLDGRHLAVRSKHSALNTVLQGAGALIMKRALVECEILLQKQGLKNSSQSSDYDYEFVLNVHDEWQAEVKEGHAELFAKLSCEAMTRAGEYFNFRCRINGSADIGDNWKETH